MLASDEKTLEPLLRPPPSLEPPLSLPPAPIQPLTDQRTSADKSLTQIKEFHEDRDRSPEIADPMIIPTDSESDDENEKSDLQFTPNQSNLSKNEKAKRRARAKAKEKSKTLISLVRERQEPWKCKICSSFFRTSAELRQHILANHKDHKHFCNRCPYSAKKSSNLVHHRQTHFMNDKVKDQAGGPQCEWCKVRFPNYGRLHLHFREFHLPDASK